MSAKDTFDLTMARCDALLKNKQVGIINEEALRFALVLAVAALDSYVSDKFMEKFVSYVKSRKGEISPQAVKFLEDSGVTLKDLLTLLKDAKARPFRSIRSIVERGYEKESFQSMKRIDELFSFYGLKNLSSNCENKVKRKNLITNVKSAIARRHEIVHAADNNKFGKRNKLENGKVTRWVTEINKFVTAMDEIVENKFSCNPLPNRGKGNKANKPKTPCAILEVNTK